MVTYIIIGITVLASIYARNNENIFHKWMLNPYQIHKKKEYYRFITSGLIHGDFVHLMFNMIALYSFGTLLEYVFEELFGTLGFIIYIILYFSSMVVADLKSYFQHKNNSHYNALGASGAVSAILFASILFFPLAGIRIFFIPIDIPAFLFGILYLIYSYYQGKRMADNIGHDAHFFGALFGMVFTLALYPSVIYGFIEQVSTWKIAF